MRTSPYAPVIRAIYQVALLIFVVTVVIGILNGLDLVDFNRDQLLTHVHAGTLGWLTLGVIATTLWIFSDDGEAPVSVGATRGLGLLAVASIAAYIVAFYSGVLFWRAALAVPVLTTIVWFLGWIWVALRSTRMTMARLGILTAVIMLLLGGTIGTLIQIQLATDAQIFPTNGDPIGAHVVAMAFSYLILFGMVVAEWRLKSGAGDVSRGGVAQISFLIAAGLVTIASLMFALDALLPLSLLFELLAVGFFARRLGGPVSRVSWLASGSGRHFAASAVFIGVDVILVVALIGTVIANQGDINATPAGLGIASDHAVFIGVMTNALIGSILFLGESVGHRLSGLVTGAIFWAVNIGLVGFLVGLLLDTRTFGEYQAGGTAQNEIVKQIFAPTMGIGLLLMIVVLSASLWAQAGSNRPVEDATG